MAYKDRSCRNCSKVYSPLSGSSLYCSKDCQKANVRATAELAREWSTSVVKACEWCGEQKLGSEFHGTPNRKDGRDPVCKRCRYDRALQIKYGLTVEEYEAKISSSGACAICGARARKMVMDHDHDSGEVREVLCNNCNAAIGFLADSSARAESACAYLKKWGK